MNTTRVHILYTGGTIGMAQKSEDNPELVAKPLNELLQYVPSWENKRGKNTTKDINLENGITLTFSSIKPVDSSNITPQDWLDMADKIEAVYDDHDGFVILHGTDTMAYTASGLAFIFENLAKPVVVTGSQLPISHIRTDAVMNLVNAVEIAAWNATGLPCIPEVIICFADKILRGCRTSKVSSTSWAGFDSPNFPPLGEIGEHIRINKSLLLPQSKPKKFQVNRHLNTNVMDVSLNPGMKASQLEAIMALSDIDAVLLRTYGAGNAPDKEPFLNAIKKIARNKTIVNITQCTQGMVEMGLYAASSGMLERGVISGLDMTPEAALTKLYWTLGTKIGEQRVSQMQVSQRGEQSENLFDLRYPACGNSDEPTDRYDEYVIPDRRFTNDDRFSRAVVRFQNLGVTGVKKGEKANIRIFINKINANVETLSDDDKCIASFSFIYYGETTNPVREIERSIAHSNLDAGEVTLSVRSDKGVKFWFEGLYLALFAKA